MEKKVTLQTSLRVIEILEKCFLKKGRFKDPSLQVNPTEGLAGISNRSYSKRCQRFMTDFGIEESFHQAVIRMKEHHGVEVNFGAVRNITEKYVGRIQNAIFFSQD